MTCPHSFTLTAVFRWWWVVKVHFAEILDIILYWSNVVDLQGHSPNGVAQWLWAQNSEAGRSGFKSCFGSSVTLRKWPVLGGSTFIFWRMGTEHSPGGILVLGETIPGHLTPGAQHSVRISDAMGSCPGSHRSWDAYPTQPLLEGCSSSGFDHDSLPFFTSCLHGQDGRLSCTNVPIDWEISIWSPTLAHHSITCPCSWTDCQNSQHF